MELGLNTPTLQLLKADPEKLDCSFMSRLGMPTVEIPNTRTDVEFPSKKEATVKPEISK